MHGATKRKLRCNTAKSKKGIIEQVWQVVSSAWKGSSAASSDPTSAVAASADPVRWFASASGGKEFECSAEMACLLEAEFTKPKGKRSKVTHQDGTRRYECDVNTMEQKNVVSKKVRKLRRDAPSAAAHSDSAQGYAAGASGSSGSSGSSSSSRSSASKGSSKPGIWSANIGGGKILDYPKKTQELLEAELLKPDGQRQPVPYTNGSQKYELDVSLMKQINMDTHKKRPMFRKQPKD